MLTETIFRPSNLTPSVNFTRRYHRNARIFQSSNTPGETVWYGSSDIAPLVHPDATITPDVGDLYLHQDRSSSSLQLWISDNQGHWNSVAVEFNRSYLPDRIVMGVSHPRFNNRLLKLRANGEPSWVTRQTLATPKSRKKASGKVAQE